MTADVADEMRLRQGKERSGLLYALTTLTTKLAGGVSVLITLPALAAVGYDPALRDANTPQAVQALEIAFLAGPVFFVMLGAACLIGYRLTAERAAEVRRQLEARAAAAPDPAASLEGLTGEELAPPQPSR
jgi:Na+/melibiose symporter-like transporter